jgi:DNA invertase Pin-like site-specific DNA recombinase
LRATATYDLNTTDLIPARKRLLEAHQEFGSWHKLAKHLRINVGFVYKFAIHGNLPRSSAIRRKLLGRKTINEHLATDPIADMPTPLLAWALANREEM